MPVRAAVSLLAALALGGCALSQSTPKVAIDYNRDFAKSRNEMLLLNVLRAAAREPLQFSTLGNVSGQVGNGATIRIPFTNLIGGGASVVSPDLTITDAVNPTVSINPLAGKDFATGILRPIGSDTIGLFLHNGWDAEFLLPLIVGGVVCPGSDRLLLNSGEYLERGEDKIWRRTILHQSFAEFFAESGRKFSIESVAPKDLQERSYVLSNPEALAVLKDGVGAGFVVARVEAGPDPGKKIIIVQKPNRTVAQGLDVAAFCQKVELREKKVQDEARLAGRPVRPPFRYILERNVVDTSTTAVAVVGGDKKADRGKVIFRSVGSIIQYLGEAHRVRFLGVPKDPAGLTYTNQEGRQQILFRAQWGLRNEPRAVQTAYQGNVFYVPQLVLGEEEGPDRTLKTLAFLDQLIALQTSESSFRGVQPVITVN